MDIIAPIPPNLYNVKAVNPGKSVDGAVQHNLLPQQFLQATVVTGGASDVVLNFAGENVAAQTEQPLLSGQKLNLQVISTEPQLKLQIVADSADPVLLRLVHVFDHRSELGTKLNQLLQQRSASVPASNTNPLPNPATTTTTSAPTLPVIPTGQASATLTGIAPGVAGEQSAGGAVTATPAGSTPSNPVANSPAGASNPAIEVPVQAGQTASVATAASVTPGLPTAINSKSNPVIEPASTQVTGQLPTAVSSGAEKSVTLSPLPATPIPESAMTKQPLAAALSAQQWQHIEHLATGLTSAMNSPNEKLVANMARMLGLDFEFLTAHGQSEQAGQTQKGEQAQLGLKGMLTSLRDNSEVAGMVREQAASITQQLETLQLCRLRLAQEGVLFLPLPFEFLEQGYVLFEQHSQQESADADGSTQPSYLVSINLSMAKLGPIQANLLFEQQQLFVRILCADDAKVDMVRQNLDELRKGLQEYHLGSVQVTTGAKDPALELMRRLQKSEQAEHSPSLFDARV